MTRDLRPQDVSWILDMHDRGQLDLDPPYQRRSVWTSQDRRFFIDTIMNGYPSPPIFMHQTRDDEGRATYHVVDGKQRLEAIIAFRHDKVRLPDDFVDAQWQNKRWSDLGKDEREKFWNYPIIIEILPNVDDAYIRNVFDRINRNSRKLVPPELRHAKFDGWFIQTAEAEAGRPEWREFGVVTTARAKRMQDVQFISELMLVTIKQSLQGFDQGSLDDAYGEYDELHDHPTFVEEDFRAAFERTKSQISALIESVSEIASFLRIQNHFYSLWGYLTLEYRDTPMNGWANRYNRFLADADALLRNSGREHIHDDSTQRPTTTTYERSVAQYASHMRGASTELLARQQRHNALKTAMKAEGAANEGQ